MLYEIVLTNNVLNSQDIQRFEENILNSPTKIDKLFIPPGFLNKFKRNPFLSSIIDYPLGIAPTVLREKEIEFSIGGGAMHIDLIISPQLCVDKNSEAIYNDFLDCRKVCRKHEITIRPLIEYRFTDKFYVVELAKILQNTGVTEIGIGTGSVWDNPLDLYDICNLLYRDTKLNLSIGYNEPEKIQNIVEKFDVYSLRFYNKNPV